MLYATCLSALPVAPISQLFRDYNMQISQIHYLFQGKLIPPIKEWLQICISYMGWPSIQSKIKYPYKIESSFVAVAISWLETGKPRSRHNTHSKVSSSSEPSGSGNLRENHSFHAVQKICTECHTDIWPRFNAQRCIFAAAKGGYPDGQQRLLISHQCKLASEKVLVELFYSKHYQ